MKLKARAEDRLRIKEQDEVFVTVSVFIHVMDVFTEDFIQGIFYPRPI